MSGIFGSLNDAPFERWASMDAAMAHWGSDGGGFWHDDRCGLGQRLLFNTPASGLLDRT
jgi:asparagine synthase (glutamine-hydrolysing)